MWIVIAALKRPYTVVAAALLIAFLGIATIVTTPTDVFPSIDIPVATVIWQYPGMPASEMASRITTVSERAMTTTVNDIEHMESQSLNGVAVIKVYFHPNARIEAGVAQITAISQTLLGLFPPGMTPPLVLQYNASSVPILQMALESPTLTEQELYDYGLNFIRTQLATVQGASLPLPYGGKQRQVMVDLDPAALRAHSLTPSDISLALAAQNLILPAGTLKMGATEYNVRLNASVDKAEDMNRMPVRPGVLLGDVASVRDGFAVQTNIVNLNGHRSALLTALKSGRASTLDVVERLKKRLPAVKATLPDDLDIQTLFDQSVFVRASINGVLREGVIAALLSGAMILLFLGSWRSTLIVVTSIPLAILCSIIALGALGQTLNVMTLGGLALAIGILVDDGTVEIENIHRNVHEGKLDLTGAILAAASEIAVPTLVSTAAICAVFVSVVFLTGPARYLFTPLALAVVFAMMASYLLSRTLVPTMARWLLVHDHPVSTKFDAFFEKVRDRYMAILEWNLANPRKVFGIFLGLLAWSAMLVPWVGRDFFPTVDAGMLRLHVRTPAGTRLEETDRYFHDVVKVVRENIPEVESSMSNIGLPPGGVNLAFSDSATIGANDGEILISTRPGHTAQNMAKLREILPQRFPELTFYFQPADIVNQILNFGLPAPIVLQVVGRSPDNLAVAKDLTARIRQVPGAVDVRLHEVVDTPELYVDVDRLRAQAVGLTQNDVGTNLLVSLSSTAKLRPNYWIDPKNGVQYQVAVQTPQYKMQSLEDLMNSQVAAGQQLSNLATIKRGVTTQNVDHYNVQNVYSVMANVQGRDLGGVASDVRKIMAQTRLPKGSSLSLRGQVQSMDSSFTRLGFGIVFAIVLVYLLMAVNFQSWSDPFIIIAGLPGALAGVVWMLFLSQTTFNVPSLMGTIMCIGVATANSILMVTFANQQRAQGESSVHAALQAGHTRLRPVLMTALAMILGMLPMALGLGEGGEQNAPLGRAAIGGLSLGTLTTLFLVPVVYSLVRRKSAPYVDERLKDL